MLIVGDIIAGIVHELLNQFLDLFEASSEIGLVARGFVVACGDVLVVAHLLL